MNAARRAAHWTMRAACSLAPANRREWCAAMQAEFECLDSDRDALSWAAGAFSSAVGGRVVDQGPFLAGLMVAPVFLSLAETAAFLTFAGRMSDWQKAFLVTDGIVMFLLAFCLSLYRPRLAILSSLVVSFIGPEGLISWTSDVSGHYEGSLMRWAHIVWTSPDTPAMNNPHLHNWQLALIPVLLRLGPCVFGAAVGCGVAWVSARLQSKQEVAPNRSI